MILSDLYIYISFNTITFKTITEYDDFILIQIPYNIELNYLYMTIVCIVLLVRVDLPFVYVFDRSKVGINKSLNQ